MTVAVEVDGTESAGLSDVVIGADEDDKEHLPLSSPLLLLLSSLAALVITGVAS